MLKLDEIDKDFIEFYQSMGEAHGMDNLLTKIFAILYIKSKEVAMEDLAKETGYSLATISNKIKFFENFGIISKTNKPGTRKIFLRVDNDMLKILKETLMKKQQYGINTAKSKLPTIIKKHKSKAKTLEQKRKLRVIENYYNQVLKIEKVFKDFIGKLNQLENE